MRLTLRSKLLLVSLSLLTLPWVGYRYVNEMESFLRGAQEQALLARAQAAAAVLAAQGEPFARHAARVAGVPDEHIYFVRSLAEPVQLDGYPEEWLPWLDLARRFDGPHGYRVRHLLSADAGAVYALFLVEDDATVYRDPARRIEGDHLRLLLGGRQYLLSTEAPGRLNAYEVTADGGVGRWEQTIRGEWQEVPGGYAIELRIPLGSTAAGVGFALHDVDRLGEPAGELLTAGAGGRGVLLRPDPALERLLAGLATDDSRAWVVDTGGRVLAVAGRLAAAEPDADGGAWLADLLFGLFVPVPAYGFSDALARASRLDGPEVTAALTGQAGGRRRATADGRAVISSAAFPVTVAGGVAGAVVVEQTTNAILSVQNQAMQSLAASTLLALGVALAVLLTFATRLSLRIRRLRDEAEAAIGPDGRVQGGVGGSTAGDELGDLSRSFADLLRRLGQYNRYLETMAGKLAHELRTPVVVVKSSLENLEQAAGVDERAVYQQRARDGIDRLGTILQRLSEATRLEQALQEAEPEPVDLRELVTALGEGYRTAYPAAAFTIDAGDGPLRVLAAPDLLAQMLDKLVANAVDFAAPGTPIRIAVARDDGHARLAVGNRGPTLPAEMADRLFDSMVSLREKKGDTPHLGLGLHIVRLVAEFHGGSVAAENLPAGDGVVFTVRLPLAAPQ